MQLSQLVPWFNLLPYLVWFSIGNEKVKCTGFTPLAGQILSQGGKPHFLGSQSSFPGILES